MLRAICFSKDRPLQLEAFIESLMHYSGLKPEAISIIYTNSPGIDYTATIARHPLVDWVNESDFQADLTAIVERSKGYVLLGCDDVVFKDYFDLNVPISILQQDPAIFGFSLRLGTNIRFMPTFESADDTTLIWDWRQARDSYWRYAWEVSASVYRNDFVLDYLRSRSDLSNPNRFEAHLATDLAADNSLVPPRLASFLTSRCVTITVNRVQDEYENAFDTSAQTDPAELFRDYQQGLRLDWPALFRWDNRSVHTGAESFRLSSTVALPTTGYTIESGSAEDGRRARPRFLRLRVFYWRLLIVAWESARKYLPKRVLDMVRKIAHRHSAPQ